MTGREAWDQARARALAPGRADPQGNLAGGPAALAAAAELMRPCATPVPGGTCGAPKAEHHLPDRGRRRLYCTRQEGPCRCPCTAYTPAPEETP
jgi:hypothetical protein